MSRMAFARCPGFLLFHRPRARPQPKTGMFRRAPLSWRSRCPEPAGGCLASNRYFAGGRDRYVKHGKPKRLFVKELCKNARRSLEAQHLKAALALVEDKAPPPAAPRG